METHVIAIARPAEGKAERVDSLINSIIIGPPASATHPDTDISRYRLYGNQDTGRIAMVETRAPSIIQRTDPTSTSDNFPHATSAASPELLEMFQTFEQEQLLAAPADLIVVKGVDRDSPTESPLGSPAASPRGSLAGSELNAVDRSLASLGRRESVVGPEHADGMEAWYDI